MRSISKQTLLAPMLLLALVACNSGESTQAVEPVVDEASPYNLASKSQNELFTVDIRTTDAGGTDSVEFTVGQQIYFTLTATNLTGQAQTLSGPDSGYPAYCIRRTEASACLWDSRFGGVFTQALIPFDFSAFEARDFSRVTEQIDNNGTALPTGEYEIRGILGYDSGGDLLSSSWHSFAIAE